MLPPPLCWLTSRHTKPLSLGVISLVQQVEGEEEGFSARIFTTKGACCAVCECGVMWRDMAGRVFKNKPAPDNLEVPPHMYLSDTKILIGDDKKA